MCLFRQLTYFTIKSYATSCQIHSLCQCVPAISDMLRQTIITSRSASNFSSENWIKRDLHNREIISGKIVPPNMLGFRQLNTEKKLPIIYLFTKEGCTLCDVAVEALKPHMHRFVLKEVDITLPENEKWYEMYKYDIPVFHIYEEFLFKHRVDFDALERGLEKYKDGYDVRK